MLCWKSTSRSGECGRQICGQDQGSNEDASCGASDKCLNTIVDIQIRQHWQFMWEKSISNHLI